MSLYLAFLRVKKDEDAPRRCTANAIEMLAATRTPSRFVEGGPPRRSADGGAHRGTFPNSMSP